MRSANYTNNPLNQITTRTVPNAVDIIGTSTATNVVTVNGSAADYRRRSFFREELAVTNASASAWTPATVVADTTKTGHILTPASPADV